jgi:hypothetical protein
MTRGHRRAHLWAWTLIAIAVAAAWAVTRWGGAP